MQRTEERRRRAGERKAREGRRECWWERDRTDGCRKGAARAKDAKEDGIPREGRQRRGLPRESCHERKWVRCGRRSGSPVGGPSLCLCTLKGRSSRVLISARKLDNHRRGDLPFCEDGFLVIFIHPTTTQSSQADEVDKIPPRSHPPRGRPFRMLLARALARR